VNQLLILLLCAMALAACSNISEKRTLLSAAGFRTVPATTPAQLAKLHSMKPGKIVPLVGKNGTVYVFADTPRKALLVGGSTQYQAYKKLDVRQKKINEQLLEAQANMDNSDWNAWGPESYGNCGWSTASDPLP
jgi:hypothetical protein